VEWPPSSKWPCHVSFLRRPWRVKNFYAASIKSVLLGTDPVGYIGCCAALRDVDHSEMLRQIHVPTLAIVGDRDVSTPWEGHGEILAREIPGAQIVRLPAAAHLSNIECPHSFTAALLDFLQPASARVNDPMEAGYAVRRAVLGDAHVDGQSLGLTTLIVISRC
jgi:3-oxoadipate enol-lactonase / 4-carboxymuconolactone decarboxylase